MGDCRIDKSDLLHWYCEEHQMLVFYHGEGQYICMGRMREERDAAIAERDAIIIECGSLKEDLVALIKERDRLSTQVSQLMARLRVACDDLEMVKECANLSEVQERAQRLTTIMRDLLAVLNGTCVLQSWLAAIRLAGHEFYAVSGMYFASPDDVQEGMDKIMAARKAQEQAQRLEGALRELVDAVAKGWSTEKAIKSIIQARSSAWRVLYDLDETEDAQ